MESKAKFQEYVRRFVELGEEQIVADDKVADVVAEYDPKLAEKMRAVIVPFREAIAYARTRLEDVSPPVLVITKEQAEMVERSKEWMRMIVPKDRVAALAAARNPTPIVAEEVHFVGPANPEQMEKLAKEWRRALDDSTNVFGIPENVLKGDAPFPTRPEDMTLVKGKA